MSSEVLVIGAGVCGLTAIKACLEEGLNPVCFERYDDIGGLWNYSADVKLGQGASVYKGLITNLSKEMMCFSDFPMPDHFTTFVTSNLYLKYLRAYADKFDLLKHITYNVNVLTVKKFANYGETGQWDVTYQLQDGVTKERIFDKVIVATGFYREPSSPDLPGLETFPGEVLHSHAFRDPQDYEGKRVIVVGNGISAGDISALLGYTAEQVLLSIGSGTWLVPKTSNGGVPFDFDFVKRASLIAPLWLVGILLGPMLDKNLNHERCGLTSSVPLASSTGVMVSDDLKARILCGKVKVKARIVRMEGNVAYFEDGTTEAGIDTVMFATGFKQHYPFLEKDVMPDNYEESSLYMTVWPTSLEHSSLAVIGYFAILGSVGPVVELQARWAAGVFCGRLKLASKDIMVSQVKKAKSEVFKRLGQYKCKLDGRIYPDQVAKLIGCRPNIINYLFTDPKVGIKMIFGPLFPVQYRMEGPHKWNKARELFLTAYNRTLYSTQTRKPAEIKKGRSLFKLAFLLGVCSCGLYLLRDYLHILMNRFYPH